jgi:hypothetical protein
MVAPCRRPVIAIGPDIWLGAGSNTMGMPVSATRIGLWLWPKAEKEEKQSKQRLAVTDPEKPTEFLLFQQIVTSYGRVAEATAAVYRKLAVASPK